MGNAVKFMISKRSDKDAQSKDSLDKRQQKAFCFDDNRLIHISFRFPDICSQTQRFATVGRTGEHKILLLHKNAWSVQKLLPKGASAIIRRFVIYNMSVEDQFSLRRHLLMRRVAKKSNFLNGINQL